jgi:hypothetical protein
MSTLVRGTKKVEDPYSPGTDIADPLTLVTLAIQRSEDFHTSWVEKIEKRYRAYRGVAEARHQQTQTWRSNLTTPYLLQLGEGMLATMLDPKPTWEVQPRPLPGESVEEVSARGQSARVAKAALQWAMDADDFHLKQRPFMQQDLIAGATVAKVVWAYEARKMTKLHAVEVEVTNDYTGEVSDRYTDSEEREDMHVLRDGPSMIVRDVRDFFWPESAKSVADAAWVIDRTWSTYDELKAKQDAGLYRYVGELENAVGGQDPRSASEREQELWSKNRSAGLIEVLEYWTDERLITVGNRQVVLADVPNPFKIKRKPFVMCSAMPDAFQMVGISVMESLAQLQEYLWTIQNQRLDALRLLTNVITLIRSDVDDPDSFEFYPGAQWIVEDPGQVGQLEIDPTAAQITLEAEALIKGDLQNMLGGLPMAGGVSSGSVDQETATGMSIITSIAQKLIQARKQQYAWAWGQVGELFLGMMGQMIREERVIASVGPQGKQQLQAVHPLDLQGEFDVAINVMDESTVRQERRSEAMALVNLLVPLQMMGVDPKPAIEMLLESYGVQDPQKFFTPPAPPQGALPPGQGTPQGAAGIQQGMAPNGNPVGSQGQTNPALAAQMGGGSGQAGLSMSPDQFAMQQLQAVQQMGLGAQG